MCCGCCKDPELLEEAIERIGWLGPLALVGLNALQIVVAPIPGYVVPIAAGFLYGPVMGSLWGALGLLLGATIAFWLARQYGRPVAEKLAGRRGWTGGNRHPQHQHARLVHSSARPDWGYSLLLGLPISCRLPQDYRDHRDPAHSQHHRGGLGGRRRDVVFGVAIGCDRGWSGGDRGCVFALPAPIMFWFEGRVRQELKEELGQDTQ